MWILQGWFESSSHKLFQFPAEDLTWDISDNTFLAEWTQHPPGNFALLSAEFGGYGLAGGGNVCLFV